MHACSKHADTAATEADTKLNDEKRKHINKNQIRTLMRDPQNGNPPQPLNPKP